MEKILLMGMKPALRLLRAGKKPMNLIPARGTDATCFKQITTMWGLQVIK